MDKYKVGEVWLYQQREQEENSTVIINKVELGSDQLPIYHITIRDVKIANSNSPTGFTDKIGHAPVSVETLQQSLTTKIANAQVDSDYLEGYEAWYNAHMAGQTGVFTNTVAEIVNYIEQAINSQQ
ncbi:hypothetical protein [Entomomonas asaccharolytica]|uniref:Uncharacterized protein n=1 Tax=Entomomonas asaccharolytica TaxID=2785331 RepID=A0A974NEW5_9GAMM|nr:hypothetical protein [Entomomonas asaccharolytica]QQP85142.1 hypothetical protein JHT90_12235 [Entomomonas asaccharolytica]